MTRLWTRYSLYACLPVALAAVLLLLLLPRGATSQTQVWSADIVLSTGVHISDAVAGNPLVDLFSCPEGSNLTSSYRWAAHSPHPKQAHWTQGPISAPPSLAWNGLYVIERRIDLPNGDPLIVAVLTGTPLRAGTTALTIRWGCGDGGWFLPNQKEHVGIEVTGDDFHHPDGVSHHIGHVHSLPPAASWADTHAEYANTCRNLGGFYDTEWDRGATPRSDPHGHCCVPAEADANHRTASGCQNSKLPPAPANDDSEGGGSGDGEPASDE